MFNTPIQQLFTDDKYNLIYVKRDDLIPFSFGGNKVRIAKEFIEDMKNKSCNCMIGYGNARSNLSRVLANLCAKEGIECHLISPADNDGTKVHTFNEKFCNICNAKIHECLKTNVAETVQNVIDLCIKKGLKPYYINGNKYGKGNEEIPVRAYFKAYDEINLFEKNNRLNFDYIILPTGTGMTQAGLICGVEKNKKKTKIIGISIARTEELEKDVLKNFILKFSEANNLIPPSEESIIIRDEYLCGGYAKSSQEVKDCIYKMYMNYGLPLDANYTGKAFYGMMDFIKRNKIENKKILFIHTGGLPLFFDLFRKGNGIFDIKEIKDSTKLYGFLKELDLKLPTPLSSRVNIADFINKVIRNGKVLGIEVDGKVIAASLFYCNDMITRRAYITLIGILDEYSGQGIGSEILKSTFAFCKREGMQSIALETDRLNMKAISLYSKEGFIIESVDEKVHFIRSL